jgi:hypothetical protein
LLAVCVVTLGLAPGLAQAIVVTDGNLTAANPVNPAGVRPGCHYELHTVRLVAGTTYTIDLRSNAFDAYLVLADDAGLVLAEDDDSGGGLDARIVWRARYTGAYRIYATTYARGAQGAYRLSVNP